MAKAKKTLPKEIPTTKTPEESSELFFKIIAASVSGNPKPVKKKTDKKK